MTYIALQLITDPVFKNICVGTGLVVRKLKWWYKHANSIKSYYNYRSPNQ